VTSSTRGTFARSDPERFETNKAHPERVARSIELVERGYLKATEATAQIGCSLTTFYRLRERYLRTNTVRFGSVARPRLPKSQKEIRDRSIVEIALHDPDLGPAKIAQELRRAGVPYGAASENTVFRVLRKHGLSTCGKRWDASFGSIVDGDIVQPWATPTLSAFGSALALACAERGGGFRYCPEG
jgi:transposase